MNNFLEEFINGINKLMENIDKLNDKNIEHSLQFLKEAKTDLESSKILYDQRYYSRAVYFLQQSVEKACKSYYILNTQKNYKDIAREINHYSPKVFIELLENEFSFIFSLNKIYKNLPGNTKPLREIVESPKKRNELGTLPKEEIQKLLKILDEIKNNLELYKEYFYIVLSGSYSLKDKEKNSIISIISLFILANITFPHNFSTRYPDGDIKPSDYKKGMGIVDCFEEIYKKTKESIDALEEHILVIKTNKGAP